jgi:short-subunit dehydrogenase
MRLGDFYLFGSLTKHLAGKRFAIYGDVKQAVSSWIKSLDLDLCYAGIKAFVP